MKNEACQFDSCRFSRVCNHIHCIREGCTYVLHSSGQLYSHKRKHERRDAELAYRSFFSSLFQFFSSDIQFSDRWRFYQQHCSQHGLDGQRQQRPYLIARHHGRRPAKSNEFVDVRLVPSHQRSVADRLPLRPDAFVVQSTGNGPPAASATGRTGAEAPGRGRQTQADRCSSSTSQSVSGDERRRRVSIVSSPDRSRQTVPTRLPNLPARTLPLQV